MLNPIQVLSSDITTLSLEATQSANYTEGDSYFTTSLSMSPVSRAQTHHSELRTSVPENIIIKLIDMWCHKRRSQLRHVFFFNMQVSHLSNNVQWGGVNVSGAGDVQSRRGLAWAV